MPDPIDTSAEAVERMAGGLADDRPGKGHAAALLRALAAERDFMISGLSALVHCQSHLPRAVIREAAADLLRKIKRRPVDFGPPFNQSPFVDRALAAEFDRDAAYARGWRDGRDAAAAGWAYDAKAFERLSPLFVKICREREAAALALEPPEPKP